MYGLKPSMLDVRYFACHDGTPVIRVGRLLRIDQMGFLRLSGIFWCITVCR